MGTFNDLSGNRYDMLYVIRRVDNSSDGYVQYLCQCDCGNYKIIKADNLRNGNTHSCGCLKKKMMAEKQFKHGSSGGRHGQSTRLYRIWRGMLSRCYTKSATEYDRYGGRGISVCDDWRYDYCSFMDWAMSNGYSDDLTIDRINNDSDYSPDNCRWVPFEKQLLNKSNNRLLSFNGQIKTITEWANEYNIDRRLLGSRIDRYGWPIDKALTTPVRSRCD